jgi:hypothetical protein
MTLYLEAPVLALDMGEVITLDDAAGVRIQARTGTVWVTEEGDLKDHIIGAGDAFVISRRGRTLVQALAPSWISIREGVIAANDPTQTAA